MGILEIFLIGVGLSMDAFAVSICKGLSVKKLQLKHVFLVGIYFGGFQALMPFIGYFLGSQFEKFIVNIDHWVAFGLLLLIGGNMLREAIGEKDEDGEENASFAVKTMLALAVATSIDALAVGISFAFLSVNIWIATALIGVTTFVLSAIAIKIGNVFGNKFQKKAEIAGGIILILIGLKILLEHLAFI